MNGTYNAFFYGTLMAPEVLFTVLYNTARPVDAIRQLHELTPAVLEGYCRHRVKFADYPGIIPEDNSSVLGLYVTGLTEANMQKLDYFEGSEYERTMVKVKLRRGSGDELEIEENKAYSYVFLYPHRLEKGEWNFEQFHKEKMSRWTRADYIFEDCDEPARLGAELSEDEGKMREGEESGGK